MDVLEGGRTASDGVVYPWAAFSSPFWFSRVHWIAGGIADWDGAYDVTYANPLSKRSFLHGGKQSAYTTLCQIHRRVPHYLFNHFWYLIFKIVSDFFPLLCPSRPSLSPIDPRAGILGRGMPMSTKRFWRSLYTSKVITLRSTSRSINQSSHLILLYMCANDHEPRVS